MQIGRSRATDRPKRTIVQQISHARAAGEFLAWCDAWGVTSIAGARIGAALAMRVEDVFVQNRRRWVRRHEKRGKGLTISNSAMQVVPVC